ncbi:MAG: hypothetical protein ACRCX2_10520 [Paraclostridium sp.]
MSEKPKKDTSSDGTKEAIKETKKKADQNDSEGNTNNAVESKNEDVDTSNEVKELTAQDLYAAFERMTTTFESLQQDVQSLKTAKSSKPVTEATRNILASQITNIKNQSEGRMTRDVDERLAKMERALNKESMNRYKTVLDETVQHPKVKDRILKAIELSPYEEREKVYNEQLSFHQELIRDLMLSNGMQPSEMDSGIAEDLDTVVKSLFSNDVLSDGSSVLGGTTQNTNTVSADTTTTTTDTNNTAPAGE